MVVSSVSPERWLMTQRVAVAVRQRDRLERLGERADLVDLDQDRRWRRRFSMPVAQALDVGDEEVVADELARARRGAAVSALPALPVVLVEAVLDARRSGSARHQAGVELDHLRRRSCGLPSTRYLPSSKNSADGRVDARAARPGPAAARPSRSPSGSARAPPRSSRRSGAKPPSSPTVGVSAASLAHASSARGRPRCPCAGPRRSASAPKGITMNSCRSTLLSACAPPFRMFIIGTGRTRAAAPPR